MQKVCPRMYQGAQGATVAYQMQPGATPWQPECELQFLASWVSDESDVQDASWIFC